MAIGKRSSLEFELLKFKFLRKATTAYGHDTRNRGRHARDAAIRRRHGEHLRAAALLAQSMVNEIMDAQADEACAEGNSRNGYRERRLVTCVGEITLRIPKLRTGSYYPEDLLTRWSRTDRAVAATVAEMVTNGVSTRKVEKVARAMGIERMGSSQVSRICESLDEAVADMQGRDLSEVAFPYVWLDATYIKCREGGHVGSTALVTVIGAGSDGYRRLLGMGAIDTETYEGCAASSRRCASAASRGCCA